MSVLCDAKHHVAGVLLLRVHDPKGGRVDVICRKSSGTEGSCNCVRPHKVLDLVVSEPKSARNLVRVEQHLNWRLDDGLQRSKNGGVGFASLQCEVLFDQEDVVLR